MTKIEELRAAYEAATQGEWETSAHRRRDDLIDWDVCEAGGGDMIADLSSTMNGEANAKLIALMHNNLPALLEAAKLLDDLHGLMLENCSTRPFLGDMTRVLGKLQ